jgi:hypothetical protein
MGVGARSRICSLRTARVQFRGLTLDRSTLDPTADTTLRLPGTALFATAEGVVVPTTDPSRGAGGGGGGASQAGTHTPLAGTVGWNFVCTSLRDPSSLSSRSAGREEREEG